MHNEPGFAWASVAYQLDVLPFGEAWNADDLLGGDGCEARPIALGGAVERLRNVAIRSLRQSPAVHHNRA